MGVPCSDDVMLNYQSTSFHDALAMRRLFNLRPRRSFWHGSMKWAYIKEANRRIEPGAEQLQRDWKRR